MKFIGGPAHGVPLPQWVVDTLPVTVTIEATEDNSLLNDGWTGTAPVAHIYSRARWRRAHQPFHIYVFHKLSDAEIDRLARKEFP